MNTPCLYTLALVGCLSVAWAEEYYTNVWFNADAFSEDSAARQQQRRALWSLPQAREARAALQADMRRRMDTLAEQLQHPTEGQDALSPAAAQESAWLQVRAAAQQEARAALRSRPLRQMLRADYDLCEREWYDAWTPELVRGLIYAMEEQYACFDYRGDGRDERRAELLIKALGKWGWVRNGGMSEEEFKNALQQEVLYRAARLMESGMSGGAAFKTAWHQVHVGASISAPRRVRGPVVWSAPGSMHSSAGGGAGRGWQPQRLTSTYEVAETPALPQALTLAVAAALQPRRREEATDAPAAVLPPEEYPLTLDAETTERVMTMQGKVLAAFLPNKSVPVGKEAAPVPEPTAAVFTLLALSAMAVRRRRGSECVSQRFSSRLDNPDKT